MSRRLAFHSAMICFRRRRSASFVGGLLRARGIIELKSRTLLAADATASSIRNDDSFSRSNGVGEERENEETNK